MTITSGTRLGPYEVIAPIGAGGMGEVFKARDTRLERTVAIKVLPAEFADNAQLKLRFEREAKTISQLSHPNICTLYDVGDNYLVMELLDGETLADRISRGPLPLEQVIRIGIEIANALDRAHKAGVVHRDLKPSNVMLTKSGAKLLDFGLAKPAEGAISTLTSLRTEQKKGGPVTEEGAIIGTFQYMAPEQIEGGEVDARTDIFALGAVLYEMSTGRRAFAGKTKASLIASILTVDPQPVSAIAQMTPVTFDRVVRACLNKDPDERWQSAHDVAQELRWIAEPVMTSTATRNRATKPLTAIVAVIAVAMAAILGAMLWREKVARDNAMPIRTAIVPPPNATFQFVSIGAPPAISPDGTKIVFGAAENGKPQMLWLRALDSTVARPIAGTEQAIFPFWSPDSRTIGFFDAATLKTIDINGSAPVVICAVQEARGGSWSPDGRTIIFGGRFTPIYRVSATGGPPVPVTKLDRDAATHRWPEFLPDSRHFLFLACVNGNEDPANAIAVGSVDQSSWKRIISNANEPHYANGAIVFTRDGTLTAQQFDAKKLEVIGEPVALHEQHIDASHVFSRSFLAVGRDGSLVYQMTDSKAECELLWLDRGGKSQGTIGGRWNYAGVALSPDGTRAVVTTNATTPSNLWLIDLKRNVRTRLTFNTGVDVGPLWSPDGRKIIYDRVQASNSALVMKDLTTGAEETLLTAAHGAPLPTSWSSDGQRILYAASGGTTLTDIYWMSLVDRIPHPYLQTPFVESSARFSPDGKWVAYQSTESAATIDVFIAPFPPTGAKWQVSSGGGAAPKWRGDGRELFFIANGTRLMAAPVALDGTPQVGEPVQIAEYHPGSRNPLMYDVTPDGRRFIVTSRIGADAPPEPLIYMQHFDNELRDALEHRR